MKQKILSVLVSVSLIACVCACNRSTEPSETSEEETASTRHTATQMTAETTESINFTVTTSETTVATTVSESSIDDTSSSYDPNVTYYTEYAQETDPWDIGIINDTSQLTVPSYDYAENRITVGDEALFYYQGRLWVEDFDNLTVTYTDWHDDSTVLAPFILEGINTPMTDNIDGDVPECTVVSYYYTLKLLNYQYTGMDPILCYVQTDGVLDENGCLHGYIYFNPVADNVNHGLVMSGSDLIQLNEWLLAHGFAEPDPDYNGEYAEIYQQYPEFSSDYNNYPLIVLTEESYWSLSDGTFSYILYDPAAPIEALDEYGYDVWGQL